MRVSLAGSRAIVTGGSRGIGRAVAAALSQAGAEVVILGRSRAALDEAVSSGVAAKAMSVDIADRAALRAAIIEAGPTDILVNNAGTALSGPYLKDGAASFDAMLAQHVLAPAEACHAVLPAMVEKGYGRIVNIGSTASVKGYAFMAAYTAAKHAVLGLTRALSLEFARSGVTINAVCPGFTETDLVRDGMARRAGKAGRPVEDVAAEFAATKPLGRLIRPEEVAAAVVWLVSDAASGVTGQAIMVDGAEAFA